MKNVLPHARVFQLSLTLLHTKQTHCKNVHCNSEHVLNVECILYCCLLICSHGEHHQESRLPCHTNTKQPASMHQLELQSSWLLTRVLHERIEWHCFRQCKKTQATITSSRVCSGVIKHCHDRGRDQGRSRPSAALHVVCTN